MPLEDRFKGDVLPDATWGICGIHSPAGVVRLVGDNGKPSPGGICEACYAEAHDAEFFTCPIHGLNPKAKGRQGCPVSGCLGESPGPTAQEIERLALEISSVWPGGPERQQNAVDAPPARPALVGVPEAGLSVGADPGEVPALDPDRDGTPTTRTTTPAPAFTESVSVQPLRREAETPRILDASGRWVDPFLVEET